MNRPTAVKVMRAMSGGAQAKLVLADDGSFYVVKFTNNPQQRRTLVNEVIATALLHALGLPAAVSTPITFEPSFLRENPILLYFGSRSAHVPPGLHYGSRYPNIGSGRSPTIYDHVPAPILSKMRVNDMFVGAYVADQWMSNADKRQAIFYRNASRRWRVELVDHGQTFGGAAWRFTDSFAWGTFIDPMVYGEVPSFDALHEWIDRVRLLPDHVVESSDRLVPIEWIQQDSVALQQLLGQLIKRQRGLSRIIERAVSHEKSPFYSINRRRRFRMFRGQSEI
jgi:hypothetical protein